MSRCLPSLYLSAWKLSWKTGATGQWESAQSHAFLLRLYIPTLSTNWRPKEQRDLVWVPNPCCISFLPQTHTNTHTPKTQRTRPCRCWHGSPHTRITNVNIYSRICVYCTHVCKHTEPPHCCPINKGLGLGFNKGKYIFSDLQKSCHTILTCRNILWRGIK